MTNELITSEHIGGDGSPTGTALHMQGSTSIETMMFLALQENKVDALEKLIVLKERQDNRAEERLFNLAMIAAQGDMEPIVKKAYNQQTQSKYAKYEAVYDGVFPIISRHGFAMSFGTADSPLADHVRIVCDLMHSGGHSRHYQCDLHVDDVGIKGNPSKTKIHGEGSAMTYGRRYLTLLMFNVKLVDEDKDGNKESGALTEQERADLMALIEEVKPDLTKFCAMYGIERPEDLPRSMLKPACALLRQRAKR